MTFLYLVYSFKITCPNAQSGLKFSHLITESLRHPCPHVAYSSLQGGALCSPPPPRPPPPRLPVSGRGQGSGMWPELCSCGHSVSAAASSWSSTVLVLEGPLRQAPPTEEPASSRSFLEHIGTRAAQENSRLCSRSEHENSDSVTPLVCP